MSYVIFISFSPNMDQKYTGIGGSGGSFEGPHTVQSCVNDLRRSFKLLTVKEHNELPENFNPTNRMRVCTQNESGVDIDNIHEYVAPNLLIGHSFG